LGPEGVKKQVEAFVEAMPEVIDALVEAAPAFIIALAENVDELIIAIVKGIPDIIVAIIAALPEIFAALRESFRELGEEFAEGYRFERAKTIQAIKDGAVELKKNILLARDDLLAGFGPISDKFKDAGEQISTAFQNLIDNLGLKDLADSIQLLIDNLKPKGPKQPKAPKPVAEAGGQASDAFKDFRETIGFARGGSISKVSGSGFRDSVPAMLTPGEVVVDRSVSSKLLDMLEGGGNGEDTAMILMQILEAVRQPINVSTKAEVNGRAFADVILELTRTNARLSA
jgi:hypothetical protein